MVQDIYDVIGSEQNVNHEQSIREFGQTLGNFLFDRITKRQDKVSLRLSNIGNPCERKLWYQINSPDKAEPLRPEVRLKFLIGDLWEQVLLFLAKLAGHTVVGEQDEVSINGVKGHRDAVIDGVVVDVKSASTRSFDKFNNHLTSDNDNFGYLTQLNSYRSASIKDDKVVFKGMSAFLVGDKTLGKICLDTHTSDGIDYEQYVENKKKIVSQLKPPSRSFKAIPEGKSGNMKLDTVCSYCEFKKTCWPGVRTFLYAKGPIYLTTVVREPNVPEAV